MERAKEFYLERGVFQGARRSDEGKVVEFTKMVHEFEVFLRDQKMIEQHASGEAETLTIDIDGSVDLDMIEETGVGYKGNFTIDPTFNLNESEKVAGYATPEGTAAYARRSYSIVDPSNFKDVYVGHDRSEPLKLSKIIFGTAIEEEIEAPQQDFF